MGTYNEVPISVFVDGRAEGDRRPPRLSTVELLRCLSSRDVHACPIHIPVSTDVARDEGLRRAGLARSLALITFEVTPARRVCRLEDEHGPVLALDGALIPAPRSEHVRLHLHGYCGTTRRRRYTRIELRAWNLGRTWRPNALRLSLVEGHPLAEVLRETLISLQPLHFVYLARGAAVVHAREEEVEAERSLAPPVPTPVPPVAYA
jgi:hypothetical protein